MSKRSHESSLGAVVGHETTMSGTYITGPNKCHLHCQGVTHLQLIQWGLYIGETGQSLWQRNNGHKFDIGKQDVEKPVSQHFNLPGHSITDFMVAVFRQKYFKTRIDYRGFTSHYCPIDDSCCCVCTCLITSLHYKPFVDDMLLHHMWRTSCHYESWCDFYMPSLSLSATYILSIVMSCTCTIQVHRHEKIRKEEGWFNKFCLTIYQLTS